MNGEERVRVYNKCHYDIGVGLLSGIGINIKAGSFQMMTVNDILYIESMCRDRKFFAQKMLVAVDGGGKEIPFEAIGIYQEEDGQQHLSDDEIRLALRGSVKKMAEWISGVTDKTELHAIYKIAKEMDLPASKLKVLNEKIPDKDWLEE